MVKIKPQRVLVGNGMKKPAYWLHIVKNNKAFKKPIKRVKA
jgi:hypothetical protein